MVQLIHIAQSVWRPAVEILILAIIIYYVFSFVSGTRGFFILTGFLVVLLAMALVSSLLDLKVLRFILGTFSAFFTVAVLVIFQPELRHMLAQLGNLPLLQSSHEARENIEVIIQTAERLSEMRIGALVAVEQSILVQESVESGIPVDCVATPEMLESIFFPNNAIHDGGVIIKGGRITHAACIFPLTRRQDLNKSLGTRHRAAIGLSEETDAVVVVVSEETGQVAYAFRGQLIRGVSIEELRSFLTSVLVQPVKSRRLAAWLRKWAHFRLHPVALPGAADLQPKREPKPAAKLETAALAKSELEDS